MYTLVPKQLSNNGLISFRVPFAAYTPHPFPIQVPIIAPFWADVDTTLRRDDAFGEAPIGSTPINETGNVWYREEFSIELLDKARTEIRDAFIGQYSFIPTCLFIATWQNVGYFSAHVDKVNILEGMWFMK